MNTSRHNTKLSWISFDLWNILSSSFGILILGIILIFDLVLIFDLLIFDLWNFGRGNENLCFVQITTFDLNKTIYPPQHLQYEIRKVL